jgi:hypothetical protein
LAISSSVVSRTRKDYTSSAPPGKVPSQLQRCPGRAPTGSRHLKAKMSTTRGTSTSSVGSTPKSTRLPWGLKYTRLHQDPSAVSGLRALAPVSGLLLRCKRPPGPGTSLRTTLLQNTAHAATYGSWVATSDKDSSSGLLRDHVLLDPAYTATYVSIVVSGYSP